MLVAYERVETAAGAYAEILLDSDRNRNALSAQLVTDLCDALDRAGSDDVRAVLLGARGKAFCAGADLAEAFRDGMEKASRALAAVMRQIMALPLPVVARVHGTARAGGLGLVAAADVAIAADHVVYAFTEARLGLAPAIISLTALPRMDPRFAGLSFLTAAEFDGACAKESGLVTDVVPAAELDARVERVLADLLAAEPQGVAATKAVLNADALNRFDAKVDEMVALSARLFGSDTARAHLSAFAH